MNRIAFPGLGIKEFSLNKVAFEIFGREVVWYGLIITFGIVLALLYVLYRAKHDEGIKTDDIFDYAIFLVPFGVIGARLYYVIMEFENMKGKNLGETLYNCIAIWEGGLAIYGGIIAGAIALILVSLHKKIKVMKAFDMISPAVMLGQLIGRWGNFFNGEAYGWSEGVEKLPWRMYIEGAYRTETVNGVTKQIPVDFVHPTFLYESLWNLIGFIIINIFYRKKKFDGQVFLMYVSWYGLGRMFIEGLRTDSLYIGSFRVSQVVAFLCFFFGAAFLVAMLIITKLRKKDAVLAEAGASESTEEVAEAALKETKTEEVKDESDNGIFEISDTYSDEDED